MENRETFFVKPTASSSTPYLKRFNPWISDTMEHISPHVMSERQTPDTTLDPRCQSGPWPGDGVPKAGGQQAGGGLSRVPNLRVCKHPDWRVAHAVVKDELTSCCGTV